LGLVIAAVAATGQARSFAIATTLSTWLRTRLDSAVNRIYRLLRNQRVDYLEFATRWVDLLTRRPDRRVLIAIDWTEWHHDLRLLVAAMVTGKRAIPIFVQGWKKLVASRSQNTRENTFARCLAEIVRRTGVTATILCDRGFRRVSWILLLQTLGLGFVVRLMDDVVVEIEPGTSCPLGAIILRPGQVLDLGLVLLRADGAVTVRIVGYLAPDAHEPWWVPTSETGSAKDVLSLYDRRMTVEEQFRDTKGRRFGAKLFWTQFRDVEALSRFVTLLAVSLPIWMLAGIVAAQVDPSLRLRCRRKGPRQSYVTIGIRALAQPAFAARFDRDSVPLILEQPALRSIRHFAAAK
jgi:hypothetical protein